MFATVYTVLGFLLVIYEGVYCMSQPYSSPQERHNSRAQAKAIYESLKDSLLPTAKGQIVAIEEESGDSFIGATVLEAAGKARVKYPGKTFHFFRIGFPTAYV
jgi:hypothetical protein